MVDYKQVPVIKQLDWIGREFYSGLECVANAAKTAGRRIIRGTQEDKIWSVVGHGGALLLGVSAVGYYYINEPEAATVFLIAAGTIEVLDLLNSYMVGWKSKKNYNL